MGTCISKCTKPKKKFKGDLFIHVQDKLVVSQDPVPPKTTAIPLETSSSSTTTVTSSYSCSTDRNTDKRTITSSSSTSTSTSCSSALLSAKDRSFSDEFLWSCVKDNPHVISLKEKQYFATASEIQYHHPQNLHPSLRTKSKNHVPTPKKRARESSPTLARQKSFRKEHDHNPGMPNRGLRSPSLSRRFNNGAYDNEYKPVSKGNSAVSSCPRRESFRGPAASPSRGNLIGRDSSARKRDTLISKQVSKKIDDHVGVGDSRDMDVVKEDIDNPLIALDCFIFL